MDSETENPNPKCMILGRERQYITATFKYKGTYVGLLELENRASSSTWVISSKNAFDMKVFDKFSLLLLCFIVKDGLNIYLVDVKYKIPF